MKSPNIKASRAPPKKAKPLIIKDIKFVAPWNKIGFIEARDVQTEDLLWHLKIYDLEYDPDLENDVQETYIISIEWNKGVLEITTEMGTHYIVNPKTKKVSLIDN